MWREPAGELRLDEDEVHVWRAELNFAPAVEELDARERERGARFRFAPDRQRFLASHSALRRILALYLRQPAAAVAIEIAAHGKPFVAGPLRFNLSHAGELALCAVARREVGVDVERIRPGLDVLALARRFFPEAEARELDGMDAAARERFFFRLWTRREAYLKARGIGLAAIGEAAGAEWFISDLDAGPGYAGALACQLPVPRVSGWSY
jgi:4'-phosphopantetheinyl transferase